MNEAVLVAKNTLDLVPTRNIQICSAHSLTHSSEACLNFLSPGSINYLQHVDRDFNQGVKVNIQFIQQKCIKTD